MADDSQKNALIKVSDASLARYSSSLVRRGINQMKANFSVLTLSAGIFGKATMIVAENDKEETSILIKILSTLGTEVDLLQTYVSLNDIHTELSRQPFNLVLIVEYSIEGAQVPGLAPEIELRHPNARLIIMGCPRIGYPGELFISRLYTSGINLYFSILQVNAQGQRVSAVDLFALNRGFTGMGFGSLRIVTSSFVEGRLVENSYLPGDFRSLILRFRAHIP